MAYFRYESISTFLLASQEAHWNLFQVEFELKLPLVVKDKVTDEDVRENIKNILSEIPIISDIQFDEEDVLVEGNIWPSIAA